MTALRAHLFGSHARGDAKPDSDIDIVLMVEDPKAYLNDTNWISSFGEVSHSVVEDWGAVTSLRVFYTAGPEVEFSFATNDWCRLPPDLGTKHVVSQGCVIVADRGGQLTALVEACHKHLAH